LGFVRLNPNPYLHMSMKSLRAFVALAVVFFTLFTAVPGVQGVVATLGVPAQINNSTTLGFTVPPGANRLLVVNVSGSDLANLTDITGVTFNGTPMTLAVKKNDGSVAVDTLWYLAQGTNAVGTAGTIAVTAINGTVTALGAVAFQGVDQATPMNGAQSAEVTVANASSSLVVSSATGDMVMDLFDIYDPTGVGTETPGGGQTVLHDIDAPAGSLFGYYKTSIKAGAASVTMSWTSNGQAMIHVAANIRQSTGAPPSVTTPTSTGITANSATLGGNVTSDGGATITERGVVYALTATNPNPQIGGTGVTKLTAAGTTGVFTVNAPGLASNSNYSFKAYATNSAGTTYTSPASAFTTSVANNAPTNITLSSASIAENNTAGATIGTLTATDPDAGQSHTFILVGGAGSGDNGAFTITGNTLTINGVADFETKNSYSIRIRATDNGPGNLTFEKAFTIAITDVTIAQTISFGPLGGKTFGDGQFTVSATGGASGQPVTFGATGPALVSGNSVTITGAGPVTITASQAGSGDYSAATPVPQSFTVAKAPQTINFTLPATAAETDSLNITATGGASGNPGDLRRAERLRLARRPGAHLHRPRPRRRARQPGRQRELPRRDGR
jgi:hypothetical protein